ncbi:HAMP domain-containing sensor histidine kinase [Granulicella sp. dw_53]|uniref:sensor histidine kinase n=1 Tax=Granulicella sp. dw_53 TaxID=2719792 RepID=UPI001BD5651A|nr:HAMP domain-containing sensor histidine kinase [Granulicella sp. dw_53]
MYAGLGGGEGWTVPRELAAVAALCGLATTGWAVRRGRSLMAAVRLDRRVKAELEAYARLDARISSSGEVRDLCKRVCRTVAAVSVFRRVAMLVSDEEGRLVVTGSLGLDDLMVEALDGWGERTMRVGPRLRQESTGEGEGRKGRNAGARFRSETQGAAKAWTRSLVVRLELGQGETELSMGQPWFSEMRIIPLWTTAGSMVGAIAVCGLAQGGPVGAEETGPLEDLAVKLARALESVELMERLSRAERLAGLGQLAGGIARAMNHPLTEVLGYAELIAEMSRDRRVQENANTIAREATRMRQAVQGLLDLWEPVPLADEAVSMAVLARQVAAACEDNLAARGVRMVVEASEEASAVVRGRRDRLRLMLEHLLHNAAQAIVKTSAGLGYGREDAIRVTVRQGERGVQVIVSDTGPGFAEPARVFDPFYTTQHPGQGAGLGLSVCYGIVREHHGEISAFNMHPHGAAVVVELPVEVAGRASEEVEEETRLGRR